jgi:type I restriction enzyme S subunit
MNNLPKLRFPEFWDAGEWGENKLGDVSDGISSGKDKNDPDGIYDLYGSTGIIGKTSSDTCIGKYILVARVGANAGLLTIANGRFGVTDNTLIIYLKNSASIDFVYYYLDRLSLNRLIFGSGQPLITGGQLKSLNLFIPTLPEQQKIADCLSSLDDRITAEIQKLDTLKAHKKGLMQKLFPAEGETLPKLRFPEFHDSGEWEEKTLQSFCKVGDIDHKMPSSVADGIPYIMTGDFCGINNINFDNAKKISTEDYEQLSKKIRPEFGDIIIARYASVGAVRHIETNIKFLVSYSCAIIKCNRSQNSKYLYYVFQSDIIQSKIGLEINMSSQKNIGIDSIKKLNIFLPTLPEQQKIAGCLTSIDEAIAAQSQAIDLLKLHKKGLMQQLFPSLEEVRG